MYPVLVQVSNDTESITQRSFRYIAGRTVIQFLLDRLCRNFKDNTVLVTSDLDVDDVYESIAKDNNIRIYRGSSKKCLTRLAGAMKEYDFDGFIRVNGNYPLLDIDDMIKMFQMHREGNYEYSYNEHTSGLMIGTGCDAFSRECVEKLMLLGLKTSQEETIGFYIRQNEDKYRISRFVSDKSRKVYNYRISLESEKDIEIINDIAQNVEPLTNAYIGKYLESHPVLAGYNSPKSPRDVEIDRFYSHPEKVASVIKSDIDYSYPVCTEVALPDSCDLKKTYFSEMPLLEKLKEEPELPRERFFAVIKDLANGGTQGIVLTDDSEPTSCSFFSEAIDYAREYGLVVGIATNGIQRIDNEIAEKLEWIRVSLDASTSEEYKVLKGVDLFETVLNNIFHYTHHCETVGVSFSVTENNISYVEELVMRLREFGVSYIHFRPSENNMKLCSEPIDLSYLKFFETAKFKVIIDATEARDELENGHLPCYANSVTSVIRSDGSVYLCRGLGDYRWIRPIGSIYIQSFYDIWHGEERKRQLEMVKTRNFCRVNCPQCRISKLNGEINRIRNTKLVNFI